MPPYVPNDLLGFFKLLILKALFALGKKPPICL